MVSGEEDVVPLGEKEVDALVSTEQEVAPSGKREMASSVLLSGDIRAGYNYTSEEDRLLRVRLQSAYCLSPFIDPTRASVVKRVQDKCKYEAFERKCKPAKRNMEIEKSLDKFFFLELEDPKKWLSTNHIDAYRSMLSKRRESNPDDYSAALHNKELGM